MAKILSTDTAHAEAAKMMSIITGDFPSVIGKLNSHGQTLSDPNHWDGPLAQRFRNEVWPQAKGDLEKIRGSLHDLQVQVQKILTAIDKAGGA
jgi:hypothetical protein